MLAASSVALLLTACGGGGGASGNIGSPPAVAAGVPIISGTVTGFGSVIVDGTRIDDSKVAAGVELEDGSVVRAELKLGQRVEVSHDGSRVATGIGIRSEVEGPVEKVDAAAGSLVVLGQAVRINSDPAQGPVTVFGPPYTRLADIALADVVEVHGLQKIDAAGKTSIQATRIHKKNADVYNRVKGTVKDLSSTAKTFTLGELIIDFSDSKILPNATALVNGAEVHVAIPVGLVTKGVAVKAVVVKVKDRKGESGDKEAELGGLVSKLNATAKTFVMDGKTVDASVAVITPASKTLADLKDGLYVRVNGTYQADGSIRAKTISLRGAEVIKNQELELHGTVLNFASMADFTVRGISVDASAAKIDPVSCAGVTTLANLMQVEVKGSLGAGAKVIASAIQCEKSTEAISVVERKGKASGVDLTAKTFMLTLGNDTTKVAWRDITLFVRVDAASLEGKTVEVEGLMTGGVLQAAKIVLK